MPDYKKILLCLDLTDDSEKIAERARTLAATFGMNRPASIRCGTVERCSSCNSQSRLM